MLGDDRPGRWHAVFSPAPLCLALGRERAAGASEIPGGGLAVAVGAGTGQRPDLRRARLRARRQRLLASLGLRRSHPGDRPVHHPDLVLRPVADPDAALERYRHDLVEQGLGLEHAVSATAVVAGAGVLRTGRAVRSGAAAGVSAEPSPFPGRNAARRAAGGPVRSGRSGYPGDLRRAAGSARRARRTARHGRD